MYDTDSTEDRELTTEQIATAGTAPAWQDVPEPTGPQGYEDDNAAPLVTDYEDDGAPLVTDHEDDNAAPLVTDHEDDNAAPLVADHEDDNEAPLVTDHEDDNAALVADHAAPGQAVRSAPYAGNGASGTADPARRASLLEDGELQGITARWKDIQAEFVEEPKVAVQQADALVAELMQRLAVMFAAERAELENRLAGGDEVSTEDLRQGLRRYRSFFERLLAA
jgi:hypothetical protein